MPKIRNLQFLCLGACPVSDACIPHLNQCSSLTQLFLGSTQVSVQGFKALTVKLERIGCNLAGNMHLSEIAPILSLTQKKLQAISLEYDVSDSDVEAIKKLNQIKVLEVTGGLSESTFAKIAELSQIETITVSGSLAVLTNANLMKLAGMKRLKKLDIRYASHRDGLNSEGIAAFKKERPNVEFLTE
ncbi:MAG: hypothetical protein IPK32_15330 [Verrucomicrobiaceae bacterium]|nr:hypothetical protein [Verrucomicrobiaceae bacterium]